MNSRCPAAEGSELARGCDGDIGAAGVLPWESCDTQKGDQADQKGDLNYRYPKARRLLRPKSAAFGEIEKKAMMARRMQHEEEIEAQVQIDKQTEELASAHRSTV